MIPPMPYTTPHGIVSTRIRLCKVMAARSRRRTGGSRSPTPHSRVSTQHRWTGERSVEVDVGPEQGGQAAPVGVCEASPPGGVAKRDLDHDGVDVGEGRPGLSLSPGLTTRRPY